MRDDDKNYLEIRNQQVKETKKGINEVLDSMIDSAAESSIKPVFHTIGTGFVAGLGLIGTTLAYLNQEYITAATIASIGCYHAVKCDNNLQTAKSYFQAMKYLGDQKVGINHLIDEMAKRGVDVNPNNVYLDMDEENGVKLVVEELPEELLDEDGNLDMTEWDEIGKKMVDNLYDDLPSISNKDNSDHDHNDKSDNDMER